MTYIQHRQTPRLVGGLALVALLALAVPAAAAPTYALSLSQADTAQRCPAPDAVRARLVGEVAARLGRDPFSRTATRGFAVTIRLDPRGALLAELRRGGQGPALQTVRGQTCEQAIQGLATSIVSLITLDAPTVRPDPRPKPRPKTPPPTRPTPAKKKPPRPTLARPPSDEGTWWFAMGGLLGLGHNPQLASGAVMAQVRRGVLPWGSLAVELRIDPQVWGEAAQRQVGTEVYLGSLVPCFHHGWLAVCGLVSAGAVRAEGRDHPGAGKATSPFVGLGLRTALEFPTRPWAGLLRLRLHGEATAPLTRIGYHQQVASTGEKTSDTWGLPPVVGGFGLSLVTFLGKQ